MKQFPRSKPIFILLTMVMLVTAISVPLLLRGVAPSNAASHITLGSTSTDLFVNNTGIAPEAGASVISVNTLLIDLASANVTLISSGDIIIASPITWSNPNKFTTLTLDAHHSIDIDAPVTITAEGLSLITNDGNASKNGILSFNDGNISFATGSGKLAINGNNYALESNFSQLASDINSNPSGYYALAHGIDASGTTYGNEVIPTTLTGTLEGLGNAITKLTIAGVNVGNLGLLDTIGTAGTVENLGITNVNISATIVGKGATQSGVLAVFNRGTIARVFTTGTVSSTDAGGLVYDNEGAITQSFSNVNSTVTNSVSGGLAGFNAEGGTIRQSYATGNVTGDPNVSGNLGGLVGTNQSTIDQSYATGNVTNGNSIGGLVGFNQGGSITNSYATGNVGGGSEVGGLVGGNQAVISQSYATGAVQSLDTQVGGLMGFNQSGTVTNSYWDTQTTGQASAGYNTANPGTPIPGTTGLTTAQLQSGIPAGFDPTVWGSDIHLNNGYPYLLWQNPAQIATPPFSQVALNNTVQFIVNIAQAPANIGRLLGNETVQAAQCLNNPDCTAEAILNADAALHNPANYYSLAGNAVIIAMTDDIAAILRAGKTAKAAEETQALRNMEIVEEALTAKAPAQVAGKGSLTGKPEIPNPNASPANKEAIALQNQAAVTLSENGLKVQRLPLKNLEGEASPDYIIDDEPADCYAPDTTKLGTIRSGITTKVEDQAPNIVLVTDRTTVPIDDIIQSLKTSPISGLKTVYVITGTTLVSILVF